MTLDLISVVETEGFKGGLVYSGYEGER